MRGVREDEDMAYRCLHDELDRGEQESREVLESLRVFIRRYRFHALLKLDRWTLEG